MNLIENDAFTSLSLQKNEYKHIFSHRINRSSYRFFLIYLASLVICIDDLCTNDFNLACCFFFFHS